MSVDGLLRKSVLFLMWSRVFVFIEGKRSEDMPSENGINKSGHLGILCKTLAMRDGRGSG